MATVVSATGGLALSLLFLFVAQSVPASAQSQVQIGIDVVSNGSANSADTCTLVSSGDLIDIDIYVNNVTDLKAWEAYLHFEEDKLEFVSADPKVFLQSNPLTVSEALPRGRHFIGATVKSAAAESGSGVLARVTLKATASGLAMVDLPTQDVDGDGQFEIGPLLTTTGGGHPGDTNGDGIFDGQLAPAFIAIDTSCSGAPTPAPDPGSDDDDQQPEATPPAGGGDDGSSDGGGSDSDSDGDGSGSSGGSGSGSGDDDDGSGGDAVLGASDGPSSDGGDGDSDGSADGGGSDGDSGDSDSGNAEGVPNETSGGLSDALVIAIAVAGAAIVAGIAMFGLRRWRRPAN